MLILAGSAYNVPLYKADFLRPQRKYFDSYAQNYDSCELVDKRFTPKETVSLYVKIFDEAEEKAYRINGEYW